MSKRIGQSGMVERQEVVKNLWDVFSKVLSDSRYDAVAIDTQHHIATIQFQRGVDPFISMI